MVVTKYRAWFGSEMYDKPVVYDGEFYLDWRDFEDGRTYNGAILMQSTGLFDVNGKEVFEGDVVRVTCEHPIDFPDCKGVVRMLEGRYMVCDDKTERCSELFSEIFSNEVIGNIYENPELVEG
ncbi:TPA: hypothetical protein TZE08_002249 [Streptococcus suis]|nr:hypothetical protein [Streptococcus suis]HEM5086018.1 hypothetical protein [Streptococcus suis]HEM5240085.1 hypothetical protein [Streptococcus suis]HEM5318611.1 hypothetical protein [Streptococcus suis]